MLLDLKAVPSRPSRRGCSIMHLVKSFAAGFLQLYNPFRASGRASYPPSRLSGITSHRVLSCGRVPARLHIIMYGFIMLSAREGRTSSAPTFVRGRVCGWELPLESLDSLPTSSLSRGERAADCERVQAVMPQKREGPIAVIS